MPSEPKGRKPPVPGLALIKSNWTTDTAKWSFLLHALKTVASAWSGADLTSLLTDFASAVSSALIPHLGSNTSNTTNTATDLTSVMGLEVEATGVGAGSDVSATAPVPINCVMRVQYPRQMQYKGGSPGINISGLDATDRMAGSATMWSTAAQATWTSAIENLLADMLGVGLPSGSESNPVWVSYYSGFAFREPPLTFPLGGLPCVAQQRICSRRRRLGRGVLGE